MDVVIERIGRFNPEENGAPLVEQPKPSQKLLKWVMKTLESVHLDEVGKREIGNMTRQEDGGDVDD